MERGPTICSAERYVKFAVNSAIAVTAPKPPVARMLESSRLRSNLVEADSSQKKLIQALIDGAGKNQSTARIKFPWNQETNVDLFHLYSSTIPFYDDLRAGTRPPVEYYPSEVIGRMTDELLGRGDLGLRSQLLLLGNFTGNMWADLYALGLTWRNIARGNDSVFQVNLNEHLRRVLLTRLETFPRISSPDARLGISENGGDWYHFLSMAAYKCAVDVHRQEVREEKKWGEAYRMKFFGINLLLNNSSTLSGLRGEKLGSGDHRETDALGREAGRRLAVEINRQH